MPLVRAVCNVLIQLVNVLVMLATRVITVILLVVVIPPVQAAQHAISRQVNVLAILDIPVPHVVPVLPITIKMAVLAKVSLFEREAI